MTYEQPERLSRDAALSAIHGSVPERRMEAILSLALYESDWKLVQGECLTLLTDDDADIVNTAILGLGHVARLRRNLDLDLVVPALESLQGDARYAGRVGDALDDIAAFVPK
jgi:hypothetical protein